MARRATVVGFLCTIVGIIATSSKAADTHSNATFGMSSSSSSTSSDELAVVHAVRWARDPAVVVLGGSFTVCAGVQPTTYGVICCASA